MITISLPAIEVLKEKIYGLVERYTFSGRVSTLEIRSRIGSEIWLGEHKELTGLMLDVFREKMNEGRVDDVHLMRWAKIMDAVKATRYPPPLEPYCHSAFKEFKRILCIYLARLCVFPTMTGVEMRQILDWLDETQSSDRSERFAFPLTHMERLVGEAVLEILLEKNVTW